MSCQVFSRVNKVLVPAIQILQERTNNAALPNNNNRDAGLLETVRGRWCALLETQMPTEKYDYWSRIFNTVVADDNSGASFYVCLVQSGWEKTRKPGNPVPSQLGTSRKYFGISRKNWRLAEGLGVLA